MVFEPILLSSSPLIVHAPAAPQPLRLPTPLVPVTEQFTYWVNHSSTWLLYEHIWNASALTPTDP